MKVASNWHVNSEWWWCCFNFMYISYIKYTYYYTWFNKSDRRNVFIGKHAKAPKQNPNILYAWSSLQLAIFNLILAEINFSNQLQTHVELNAQALSPPPPSMTIGLISAPKMLVVIFRDLCTPGPWHLLKLQSYWSCFHQEPKTVWMNMKPHDQ